MIEPSLKIIRQWLTAHAPRILELSLNPGASAHDLAHLEVMIEQQLPADFKELYKTWNGMNDEENWGNFFYGLSFCTLDEMLADHEWKLSQIKKRMYFPLRKADIEIDASNFFNPLWLQIGNDGSRCSLCIDLSPSTSGRYGQIIFIDGENETGICMAHSTTELVLKFATDLTDDLYSLESDALEEGQHFLLPDKQIDLVHWQRAEKWSHLK